jgi:hypothetical protein
LFADKWFYIYFKMIVSNNFKTWDSWRKLTPFGKKFLFFP